MAVSYKKLWHILLDRDMKKKNFQELAGLTGYAMNRLSRDENVTTDVLGKICKALNCTIDDIIDFLPDDNKIRNSEE
ncbi:helix-turn-helix domain-containing protein [Lacrimispora defluvii]|jgi:DNA-binding Xre family transcriptional regulator|uniref:Helix-turn-helix transcriptional regulator n=1 Tax=Lacrimispora defluvii TaxID=2719233 RepID=A0ABX1VY99_9FIRM|nr:helix-turn-helix transcriptional regulator [Lacrimispora defluvii]MDD3417877.1 helix-turn-helix transcriptional regulator [Lachnospiraceae bacterium]NNJ31802.1 helix-turn-helix transcriptional regulator [Lacrimispora defluvii]